MSQVFLNFSAPFLVPILFAFLSVVAIAFLDFEKKQVWFGRHNYGIFFAIFIASYFALLIIYFLIDGEVFRTLALLFVPISLLAAILGLLVHPICDFLSIENSIGRYFRFLVLVSLLVWITYQVSYQSPLLNALSEAQDLILNRKKLHRTFR